MTPRLQGITVVVASGDDEVGSYPGDDGHKNDVEGMVLHPSKDEPHRGFALGGGFSKIFPMLCLDNNHNLGSGVYNQTGRGYPDVSAVDDHYLIGSTSLAAPVWGAVLTLVAR
ncbi:hypothetical protein QR685DRAFT_576490 [Neurospora intermedia]|uniref:Peptidase S8/S53 domain-containing protein n=1 Tax=Neurospora intermedia TaxID=5142 RepID=A0ABR3CXH2_NEUIN